MSSVIAVPSAHELPVASGSGSGSAFMQTPIEYKTDESFIDETFEQKNIRLRNKAFLEMFIVSIPLIEEMLYENNICTWKIVKKEDCYFLKWSINKNYLRNFYMPEELRQKTFLGTNLWSPQVFKFEVKIVRCSRIVNIESKTVSWIFTTELTKMHNIIYNGFSYNTSSYFFISAFQENCLLTLDQMDKLVGIFSDSCILDTDTTDSDC